MTTIRYVEPGDRDFWFTLDRHISKTEFDRKARDKMGYVILQNDIPVGLMRYNLFWDNTPFCTLLHISPVCRHGGLGRRLMLHWEKEMKQLGYEWVMVSTQSDEDAQHFYRKLGYQDAGALVLNITRAAQPMELFFVKEL